MKKAMLDTDVLYDLLEQKEPAYLPVARILSDHKKLKLKIFISTQSLFEIQQRLNSEKSPIETRDLVKQLAMLAKVIGPDNKTFNKALYSPMKDLIQALQYHVADDHHIDFLITNRTPKTSHGKVTLLSAEQLLNII